MNKQQIAETFKNLQAFICNGLEGIDGVGMFHSDNWNREQGGGGLTKTISNGAIIQKGGVAFSEVFGEITDDMKRQLNFNQGETFYATGVSLVIHPNNPHVPIIHMNVRYFEMDENTYWFGGGIDLTPHYVDPKMAQVFHQDLKTVLDQFDTAFYPQFKQRADDYFYLPHRDETRGIGGVFYDHLHEKNTNLDKTTLLNMAKALGEAFVSIYKKQVDAKKEESFHEMHLKWRNLRRGRYVEFNLVHDRGTKFGLHSHGRTESILLSMPPEASWEYMHQVESGSLEHQTLQLLKKGVDWLTIG